MQVLADLLTRQRSRHADKRSPKAERAEVLTSESRRLERADKRRRQPERASIAERGNEEKRQRRHWSRGTYSLPEELARHAPKERFAPEELRGACHEAGEDLGWEDAKKARFRTAAQMVEMWRGLDLPAWEAPYVLRDARLGYLNGYERALTSGDMSEEQISNAAESRWGERWRERLRAARKRSG